uniref:Uncharacterized protein n=1 Tax=Ananas comosus var. bracteatus TaxID=296719 RepID=A0A6V7P8X7_ANACO|nr:unnamed protein product [Ananas comosus var. bracteatus]
MVTRSLPTSRHPGVGLCDLYSLVRYRETYGVGRDRLIPRVGMLELPPALRWHKLDYTCFIFVALHIYLIPLGLVVYCAETPYMCRHMAGLGTHRAGLCRVPGRDRGSPLSPLDGFLLVLLFVWNSFGNST